MTENTAPPQINISKIAVSGGIAGAFFAIASMSIFLIGIPLIRYMFPAAILLRFRRCARSSNNAYAVWLFAE